MFTYSRSLATAGSILSLSCNDIITIELMFAGMHKYVFGQTQTHFTPSVARVKMRSEKGQKHFLCPRTSTLLLL